MEIECLRHDVQTLQTMKSLTHRLPFELFLLEEDKKNSKSVVQNQNKLYCLNI